MKTVLKDHTEPVQKSEEGAELRLVVYDETWWHTPVTTALGKHRQENWQRFQARFTWKVPDLCELHRETLWKTGFGERVCS